MEKFFKESSNFELIEIEELLLRKYDINYILNLEITEGIELIVKAITVDIEEKIWQRWLVDYLRSMGDQFINYEEYKNRILKPIAYKDSKEDLLEMANRIEEEISQKKRGE